MIIDEAFELIRSEQMILWAGSGLSMYAGYPNATNLSKKILKALSSDEKKSFDNNQPLDVICDFFIKIKRGDRTPLLNVLHQTFTQKPKSIDTHKKLSTIPHIKTIITTNYDSLFEQAYGDKLQVIAEPNELKNIINSKQQLFKVHGDLTHRESIVISKSDYTSFYNDKINNVYWTTIKERIINNNVLLIGYGLNDININTIIDSISSQLGENRKSIFLVAPGFPEYEIANLKSKNIEYIDSTGEAFVDNLLENIRKNIKHDFLTQKIGKDIYGQFLYNHDLIVDFIADGANHNISSVKPAVGHEICGLFQIGFKPEVAETSFTLLNEHISGKRFDEFEIGKDLISKIDIGLAGIQFFNESELQSLIFTPNPKVETTVDVSFHSNNVELRSVPIKLYTSRYKTRIAVELKNKKLLIEAPNTDTIEGDALTKITANLIFENGDGYGNTKEELEIYRFLKCLFEGQRFTIYFKNGDCTERSIELQNELLNLSNNYIEYFEKLRRVENYFEFRFKTIDKISDDSYDTLNYLIQVIDKETIDFDTVAQVSLPIEIDDNIDSLFEINNSSQYIVKVKNRPITLHGKELILPSFIIVIYEPEVVNSEDLKSKTAQKVEIRSRINKISEEYLEKEHSSEHDLPS